MDLLLQTLVSDVNTLMADSNWTQDDKLALEAQLLLATEGPLCLDPSPQVGLVTNQLQFNQKKFNCHALKRYFRQHRSLSCHHVCINMYLIRLENVNQTTRVCSV